MFPGSIACVAANIASSSSSSPSELISEGGVLDVAIFSIAGVLWRVEDFTTCPSSSCSILLLALAFHFLFGIIQKHSEDWDDARLPDGSHSSLSSSESTGAERFCGAMVPVWSKIAVSRAKMSARGKRTAA